MKQTKYCAQQSNYRYIKMYNADLYKKVVVKIL